MFHDFSSRPGGRGSFHTEHHASPLHSSHRSAFSQTNNSDTTPHPPRWLRWPWGSLPRSAARIQHITTDNTKAWLTTLSARPAILAWERGTPCSYTSGFECESFCSLSMGCKILIRALGYITWHHSSQSLRERKKTVCLMEDIRLSWAPPRVSQ